MKASHGATIATLVLILVSGNAQTPVVAAEEPRNALRGLVHVPSYFLSSGEVEARLRGAGGTVAITFRDEEGGAHIVRGQLRSGTAKSMMKLFEVDFGLLQPRSGAELAIEIRDEEDRAAAVPVLRRLDLAPGDYEHLMGRYRFPRFDARTRPVSEEPILPVDRRIEPLGDLLGEGAASRLTHGFYAPPLEVFLRVAPGTGAPVLVGQAPVETADFFATEDLVGLGGCFFDLAEPCEGLQLYIDGEAATWAHMTSVLHKRRLVPTSWKLACADGSGGWDVLAEGNTDARQAEAPAVGQRTLSPYVEARRGATWFMVAFFADRGAPEQLGPAPTCKDGACVGGK